VEYLAGSVDLLAARPATGAQSWPTVDGRQRRDGQGSSTTLPAAQSRAQEHRRALVEAAAFSLPQIQRCQCHAARNPQTQAFSGGTPLAGVRTLRHAGAVLNDRAQDPWTRAEQPVAGAQQLQTLHSS
jgi:hypothetical protein